MYCQAAPPQANKASVYNGGRPGDIGGKVTVYMALLSGSGSNVERDQTRAPDLSKSDVLPMRCSERWLKIAMEIFLTSAGRMTFWE